jgi:outer membrane protein TolC
MMVVNRTLNLYSRLNLRLNSRPAVASVFLAIVTAACVGAAVSAQAGAQASSPTANPTSAANPFYGSVTDLQASRLASDETLKLSLDEAVRLGLKNNLGLKEAENNEKSLQGQRNEALQDFLPTITLTGDTGVAQYNLVADGFSKALVKEFSALLLHGSSIPVISRDDLTEGQIHYKQTLFSGPVIAGWKAAGAAEKAGYFAKMSARGEVVQQVATAYLHAIAAASEVDNAKALESEDQLLLSQAHAEHEAGTASNLDELRARVQLQAQQQALIAAENALEKDLILLKREIGVDPGQKIALTDPAPYSELATQTPEEVRAVAYKSRQDYQELENQAAEFRAIHSAYRSQRLPTLSFSGYYGVSKVNDAGTHGNFSAVGTLSFPLFSEARLRGDTESAQAQLSAVDAQLENLRSNIDRQVRSALLDVDATSKLVEVARSNVELASRALSDETDRVNAGVDDNLPLVTAQAALASAQNNLVESLFQYNLSKLALARAAGILEQQYRVYLGR